MKFQKLGNSDIEISAIGFGGNVLTTFFGPVDDDKSLKTLNHAVDLGLTFMDTSNSYGGGVNEELFARLAAERRDDIVLSTKFGFVEGGVCGTPEHVREECEKSLKRLGVDVIDLYYQHRVDPDVPIEETIGAMKELITAGKVLSLGMSEAAPATIRRAHAVYPISALQTEYSMWSRFAENEILPTCQELGITYVGYSPMGRGFLSGTVTDPSTLVENDRRRGMPRLSEDNLDHNLALVQTVKDIAEAKGVGMGQIAMAWIFASPYDIVPIPGTRNPKHVEDNIAALDIVLTPDEKTLLDETFSDENVKGLRSPERVLSTVDKG
ncbi:MAG: aldo/keto reductase [Rhodospirillaceae bacterium]|nr:aldo/keto reductase [Rhodospirillaceae bacterium]